MPSDSDAPRGDLGNAVQMLAADNARMCEIVLAADALAEEIRRVLALHYDSSFPRIRAALDAYKSARNGQ